MLQGFKQNMQSESEPQKINNFDMKEQDFDGTFKLSEEEAELESANNSTAPKKVHNTVYYEITSDKSFMKGMKYSFVKDNQVLYEAKVKDNEIEIGDGIAKITRYKNGYNIVNISGQEIKITYIQIGEMNSLNVSFNHHGQKLNWIPKQPRSKIGFNGGYGRAPIQSKKNIMLQNLKHRLSFILRKMSKKTFEAECNKYIDPIIVFAIALSQIVGPLPK